MYICKIMVDSVAVRKVALGSTFFVLWLCMVGSMGRFVILDAAMGGSVGSVHVKIRGRCSSLCRPYGASCSIGMCATLANCCNGYISQSSMCWGGVMLSLTWLWLCKCLYVLLQDFVIASDIMHVFLAFSMCKITFFYGSCACWRAVSTCGHLSMELTAM